jgi:hypothetical protein
MGGERLRRSFRGVAAAEVSVDGGTNFVRAALDPRRGWAWQRFSLPWRPIDRGETLLSVRALEADGIGQPLEGARIDSHSAGRRRVTGRAEADAVQSRTQ